MNTYTEYRKKKPFDWNALLDKAIKGELTEKEHDKACKLSASWVTCACGNQCSIIPRERNGEPLDGELYGLGLEFNQEVEEKRFNHAKKTLAKIEKRSAYLIKLEMQYAKTVLERMGYGVLLGNIQI